MPKRHFHFSPSVELMLVNLPTIRQIQKILDDELLALEVKQFLKQLAIRLSEELPEIKHWDSKISDYELFLSPIRGWTVVKEDYIAVCFSMYQCVQPAYYGDRDDPFVGLYVPAQWKHIQKFTSALKRFRIPGFKHISDVENQDEMDVGYPLWSTVHMPALVKQGNLDLDGLEKAIIDRTRRLVAKEGKISDLISKLRRRQA
jgi:hypothetical protein